MKKYFLLFALFIIGLSSCNKDQVTAQAAVDDAKIQAYITTNNIPAIKDPSGIYYQIITPGTGPYPFISPVNSSIPSSTIQISYTGSFLYGIGFESSSNTTLSLANTIAGWQVGIPHINKGGRMLLIIPSALAYGPAGSGAIPPNSVLVFKIDLIGFY